MHSVNIELEVKSDSWKEVIDALEVFQKLLPGSVVTVDQTGIGYVVDSNFRARFYGKRPEVARMTEEEIETARLSYLAEPR